MITTPSVPKDYLSVLDLSPEALDHCLRLSLQVKKDRARRRRAPTSSALDGQFVALLFEKPSLRTRATFEIAIRELGGEVLAPPANVIFGAREAPGDVARNLERWVAAAVIRTYSQDGLAGFAAAAPGLHVINALTDTEHPCQAVADYLTLVEHLGTARGRTLAFIGDGNNVATSLAHAGMLLGTTVHVASPEGHDLPDAVVARCLDAARFGATVRRFRDPREAVAGADAVYTDVWTSMGQEGEAAARAAAFRPYQVNAALMAAAKPGALFLHCLPARRGQEVTDEVIDSPASVVYDQAENRLHTQKALLLMLLAPGNATC
jgi:ornithine carbamoyltransferase